MWTKLDINPGKTYLLVFSCFPKSASKSVFIPETNNPKLPNNYSLVFIPCTHCPYTKSKNKILCKSKYSEVINKIFWKTIKPCFSDKSKTSKEYF